VEPDAAERVGHMPDIGVTGYEQQAVVDRAELWEALLSSQGTVKSQASDALATLRRRYQAADDLVPEGDPS